MAQDFYDPLQVFDYIYKLVDDNKANLGLRYVAQFNEDLIPEYPSAHVTMGQIQREEHATRIFLLTFEINLWVYHADFTLDHPTRSREDIILATNVRKKLHTDKTLGGHILFGFVHQEAPGEVDRLMGDTIETVVATRLAWRGENRVSYDNA